MSSNTQQPEFLTAAQVARKLDLPTQKFLALVHGGRIKPDQKVAGRILLFSAARLPEIRAAIERDKRKPTLEEALKPLSTNTINETKDND